MKNLLFNLFFLLFSIVGFTQHNLVPNYSFEDSVVCPSNLGNPLPKPWFSAAKKSCTSGAFLHRCSSDTSASVPYNYFGYLSYQEPKTGDGYVGLDFVLGTSTRYYIESPLKDSLKKNHNYYCSFYANLTNTCQYASNNVAMLLSKGKMYGDTISNTDCVVLVPANPQIVSYGNPIITDTLNWVLVSGIYKAKGGERYITIGNFKDDAHTNIIQAYPTSSISSVAYYIDDVSVIPLDSMPLKANAGKDTTINIGDSVFIGSLINGIDSIKWQIQNTGIAIDSTRPGFWVHPLVNTCYVLTQTVNGFTSSDTVCVNVLPLPLKFTKYEVRITNETRNGINEKQVTSNWSTANEINVSHFNIQRSVNGRGFINIGSVKANNKNSNEYNFIDDKLPTTTDQLTIYYRIESVDFDGRKQYSETKRVTLNEKQETRNIVLYPNPASDVVTIECKGAKELLIIDCLGRIVYKQILRQAQNDNNQRIIINVQGLRKGVYVLSIFTVKGEIKNEKLIIQ